MATSMYTILTSPNPWSGQSPEDRGSGLKPLRPGEETKQSKELQCFIALARWLYSAIVATVSTRPMRWHWLILQFKHVWLRWFDPHQEAVETIVSLTVRLYPGTVKASPLSLGSILSNNGIADLTQIIGDV